MLNVFHFVSNNEMLRTGTSLQFFGQVLQVTDFQHVAIKKHHSEVFSVGLCFLFFFFRNNVQKPLNFVVAFFAILLLK